MQAPQGHLWRTVISRLLRQEIPTLEEKAALCCAAGVTSLSPKDPSTRVADFSLSTRSLDPSSHLAGVGSILTIGLLVCTSPQCHPAAVRRGRGIAVSAPNFKVKRKSHISRISVVPGHLHASSQRLLQAHLLLCPIIPEQVPASDFSPQRCSDPSPKLTAASPCRPSPPLAVARFLSIRCS